MSALAIRCQKYVCGNIGENQIEFLMNIDKFYEFTMAITLTNILSTVLVLSLSRVQRALPPPHSLQLFARTFNTKVRKISLPRRDLHSLSLALTNPDSSCLQICCVMERRAATVVETQLESAPQSNGGTMMNGHKTDVDYSGDWHEIFVAVNNVLSLLLTVSYLLGLIILWSM
jgi:hypothetical protein